MEKKQIVQILGIKKNNQKGFWTLNNEVVKSRGELIIANWLFYNGVSYQHEAPYKHETANADFSQYTPDFYFPEIDVYLEHWALDGKGEPPSDFTHYKRDMAWKKELHAKHKTRLLETTMAELWSGKAFDYLTKSLSELAVTSLTQTQTEKPLAESQLKMQD